MIYELIGFDEFETLEDVQRTFSTVGAGCSLVTDTESGRGKALRIVSGGGSVLVPVSPPPLTVMGASFRVRVISMESQSNRRILYRVERDGVAQYSLQMDNIGRLYTTTAGGTGNPNVTYPVPLVFGQWYHIEVKGRSADFGVDGGFFEVKLNGKTIIYIERDTNNVNGAVSVDSVRLNLAFAFGGVVDIDDITLWDETGDENNDFLGDVEVETLFANADGTITGWTPNTGTAWEAVDDTSEDGDTTYISSSTVGGSASFGVTDLASNPTEVLAVKVFGIARKDGLGDRAIKLGVVSNGIVSEGLETTLSTSYGPVIAVFNRDPDGDVTWTPLSVNALQPRVSLTL